ncbi:GGDEF domain-containing protein [Achromobacter sp. MY14]|uniref:GGDEF domain-containing protein n=1 Tax=Achromobacter TaxID=222 RepID=UPI000F8F9D39|nr:MULTISPECIES: GGDEF domain-containing protein [Achromobacter]AZS78957.1 GGDEF domain-containing protein [Achromobacter spanius]MCD0497025.1 GGDEF domain-containing protein [Achromobacter sp. MY14]
MTTSLFFLMWGLATALALPLLLPFQARGVRGIRMFIAANGLAVLSLLAVAAASLIPPGVSVIVSNAAWVGAISLVYVGVRQFFSLRPHSLRTAGISALCVLGFALLWFGTDDLTSRMLLYSGFTCASALMTGRVVFQQRKQIRTRGVVLYLMLSIFALAVLHGLRVLVYGAGWVAPVSLTEPSPWALFFIVCGSVTVPALFLALLLLVQTRLSEQMQAALTFDGLTQVHSRRSILDELERELQRCGRSGGPLAVLVLDIDHFKSINDRYGHAAGDTALRHFAKVAQNAVRATDRVGRLGGEEFVLLMVDCDPARALVHAQRVCDALRDTPLYLQGVEVPMTASGGLASYQDGDSADVILARADVALYRAKEQGRDRVEMAFGGRAPSRMQVSSLMGMAPAANGPLVTQEGAGR